MHSVDVQEFNSDRVKILQAKRSQHKSTAILTCVVISSCDQESTSSHTNELTHLWWNRYLYSIRMRKSASLKNFVLLIRVKLWERVRSRYGMSVLSGRYGCRTWLELALTRWKKSSSAMSNRSATVGTSPAQYPSRLPRRRSDSRRARSAAEHIPDQAGAATEAEKGLWHEKCHHEVTLL